MARHRAPIQLPPTNTGDEGGEGRGLPAGMMLCVLSPMSDWTKGRGLEHRYTGPGSMRADMSGPAGYTLRVERRERVVPVLVLNEAG